MARTGLSSRVETNSKENQLRQRRNRKKSAPRNPEVSKENFSIFQWFQRRFVTSASESESIHSQEQTTTKHRKRFCRPSCTCRDICCKLFFLFVLAYLIMYLRPDYSLYVRDSVENVLKKFNLTSEEFRLRPGQRLIGVRKPSMPIIIIPGIISTGLELWQGEKCAEGRFRHRFWTSIQMVDNIGRDHQCWLRHISLNLTTWGDPDSIRIRPVLGWAAADYVFPGYWLWSKVIHNLADIGYDPTNLVTLGYDWRLTPQSLEERDGYFTQLKFYVEFLRQKHGEKVALLTHSMGSTYVMFFLRWVTQQAGEQWLDENVATFLNVGGPLLGTPKAFSSVLSGEMKDTAVLGDLGRNILSKVVGKLEVFPRFFRALGSVPSMFPRGGHSVWQECSQNPAQSPKYMLTFPKDLYKKFSEKLKKLREKCDEEYDFQYGFDSILEEFYAKPELVEEIMIKNHTVEEFYDVLKILAPRYMELVNNYYDLHPTSQEKTDRWKTDSRLWTSPLSTPLPNITNFKIYCMYGYVEEPMTECGYSYGFYPQTDYCSSAFLLFNTSHSDPRLDLKSGVYLGPGDATVPLVSLGHMCAGPWKQMGGYHNPGRVQTIIREYIHKSTAFDILSTRIEDALRGGEYAVTHVEILGNRDFLTDLLLIVSKPIDDSIHKASVDKDHIPIDQDQIYSNIRDISERIMKRNKGAMRST